MNNLYISIKGSKKEGYTLMKYKPHVDKDSGEDREDVYPLWNVPKEFNTIDELLVVLFEDND